MFSTLLTRSLLTCIALTPAAYASEEMVTATAALTISDLHAVENLSPGPLTKATCAGETAPVPCLAVPLSVTGLTETGEKATITTEYAVNPEMVQKVKSDFDETADVVLRNLRPALQSGVKAKDHATRLATKRAIAQVDGTVKYRIQPGVKMPVPIEATVAQLAKRAAPRIGKPVIVTSAARTPTSQAEALRTKISLGDNIVRLYANKDAAKSVLYAYKQAKHAGGSKQQVVAAMANVIKAQTDKGVYLSNHLREGAVDIRTRDLSGWQRKQLVAAVQETPGVRNTLLESTPPHLHVEIERL
jgi:hypothetical protein